MPAFNGQFAPGKTPFGAMAWGGGGAKAPAGSNPLPSTSAAPGGAVYGGGADANADGKPDGGGGFGGGGKPAWGGGGQYGAPPAQSGHWDMGQQGAEGAWSNGYNPHWETSQTPTAPTGAASTVYQQDAAPAAAPVVNNNLPAGYQAPADFHWTPFWQGQQNDPNWDAASQSFAPERGYVMGGYRDAQITDAPGNGIDPLADPDNTAWGNGESWNQHVADIGNRQAQSKQYNDEEDARYQRELAAWNARKS